MNMTTDTIKERINATLEQLNSEELTLVENLLLQITSYLKVNKTPIEGIETSTLTPTESDSLIEQILTEVGEFPPSLSDYAVSRASIYEDLSI